jgi:ATP dependent DNA ligase-like protein
MQPIRSAAGLAQREPLRQLSDLCCGIEFSLHTQYTVLDGEIVCLDDQGCSQFNQLQLLFRRGTPRFCASDLLYLDGKDLRDAPLIERKRVLRKVVPAHSPFLLHVDHVEGEGERLFELVCKRDLEGVVAKHRQSRYTVEDHNPAWVKIKNRKYSQLIGISRIRTAIPAGPDQSCSIHGQCRPNYPVHYHVISRVAVWSWKRIGEDTMLAWENRATDRECLGKGRAGSILGHYVHRGREYFCDQIGTRYPNCHRHRRFLL